MFLHKLINRFKKAPRYPNLGSSMKTAEEVAQELNLVRDKQMEAERQKRPDLAIVHKARFEALLWVLGKDYATSSVR